MVSFLWFSLADILLDLKGVYKKMQGTVVRESGGDFPL